jgi:hypothetical protein
VTLLPCTAALAAATPATGGVIADTGLDITLVVLIAGLVLAGGLVLSAIHRAVKRRRSLREARSTRSV